MTPAPCRASYAGRGTWRMRTPCRRTRRPSVGTCATLATPAGDEAPFVHRPAAPVRAFTLRVRGAQSLARNGSAGIRPQRLSAGPQEVDPEREPDRLLGAPRPAEGD